MFFQNFQEHGRKAIISLPELLRILGAVHAGQIEHEIRVSAICIELLWRAAKIILVNVVNIDVRTGCDSCRHGCF